MNRTPEATAAVRRALSERRRRRFGRLLVLVSLGVSILLTLAPERPYGRTDPFWCLTCSSVAAADSVRNVLLFVPLGVGVALLGFGPGRAALVGLLVSGVIEATQSLIPGRTASVRDLATNVVGAGLGALALGVLRARRGVSGRVCDFAALASACLFAGTLALSGWLFAPCLPADAPWYGGHMMDVASLRHARGTIEAARLGGLAIAGGRLPDGDAIRARLAEGAPLRLRVRPGPRIDGLAPWLSLVDGRQREILVVGADADTLVWRIRTRGRALRFELPDVIAEGILAPHLGDAPVEIVLERRGNALCVRAAGDERCGLGTPAGRGWAHLVSERSLGGRARVGLDALWLATFALPLGFFLRASVAGLVAPAFAGAALAWLPQRLGLLPATAAEALATAAGLALGALAARVAKPAAARDPKRAGQLGRQA